MRWYASLSRSREIVRVRRQGSRVRLGSLAVYALPARGGRSRVAVTISKDVGGAVVRNLLRRRVKGALDALPPLAGAARMVLVLAPAAALVPYPRLAADVAAALNGLRAA